MIRRFACFTFLATLLVSFPLAAQQTASESVDSRLSRARRFVEKSDKYLYHEKLSRGMKGFGRCTLEGVEVVQFDAEIVSVVTGLEFGGPNQDMILARLSKQNLEETGIIQGMSGSPVYVVDPADGKEKLIGAVAAAFPFQKEPLAMIQPITQMLVLTSFDGKSPPTSSKAQSAFKLSDDFIREVLNPRKIDFLSLMTPKVSQQDNGQWSLARSQLPLMVGGLSPGSMAYASKHLSPFGIVPLQAGSAGLADMGENESAKFVPGSVLSVKLASGDMNVSAVGTITEVLDDRLLAFGHKFFGEGDASFPIGRAYVHTVVSNQRISFLMASATEDVGALKRDETVGVVGVVGEKAETIPMTVKVSSKGQDDLRIYNFNICKHNFLTPFLSAMLASDSVTGWSNLPIDHTLSYSVEIDFGKLGKYKTENFVSNYDTMPIISDIARPLMAMINSPLGEPPKVHSINVDVVIEPKNFSARIMDFELDGRVYKPGQTVKGKVKVIPFRQNEVSIPVEFKLPDNIPDGPYRLTVCDSDDATKHLMREQPQRFDPRTNDDLFEALQAVVQNRADRLYLRLPLDRKGLALGKKELPDLPESKSKILSETPKSDIKTFEDVLVRSKPTAYFIAGSAVASFEVRKHPKEIILR